VKQKKDEAAPKTVFDIDASQVARIEPEKYVVDLMVDQVPWRLMLPTMNLQCLMSSLTYLATINHPRVQGWNIYAAEGPDKSKLLMSVSTIDFVSNVTKATPLKLAPGNTASKGIFPLITPTSEAFTKMLEQSKKDGRIPK
jgi:hypothetical protein